MGAGQSSPYLDASWQNQVGSQEAAYDSDEAAGTWGLGLATFEGELQTKQFARKKR
jgi:hypothetical protein